MNMISVTSSNINSIGYENSTLYIRFNSGGLYCYSNVSQSVYNNLMSAASYGHYFRENIKGKYPYRRIG